MRRILTALAVTAATAGAASVPAAEAAPAAVDPGSFTFVGTPGPDPEYHDLTLSFDLRTKQVLTRTVKVTVAGHRAVRVTRFSRDTVYTAWLKPTVKLAFERKVTVTVKIGGGPTRSYRVKVPKPGI